MTTADDDHPEERAGMTTDSMYDHTELPEQSDLSNLSWEPPGPGGWLLDSTHHGRRPVSGYLAERYRHVFGSIGTMFERYGLPLEGMDVATVNDVDYVRPRGVGEGDKPKPPPPRWLMWLVARLHPELRRRNRTAVEAWAERRWRNDVDTWFDHDRAGVVDRNRDFGAIDLTALDDERLLEHLREVTEHFTTEAIAGFVGHGGDMVPTGDFLAHCRRWGISAGDAAALLRGSSPASVETAHLLAPVARALASTTDTPDSVAAVRSLGPQVAQAVDGWLDLHGWRLISSDDIDAPTLAELPDLQLRALLSAAEPTDDTPPDAAPLRGQVPPAERAHFDDLLTEARYGMRLRDDAVGVRWNWPAGLIRRALLEVGRRLADRGHLDDPADAVEIHEDELPGLLLRGEGPTASDLSARRRRRSAIEAADPPFTLGEPEEPPPLDALPPAMARAAAAIMTLIETMTGEPAEQPLTGVGLGDTPYRGRVCLVNGAADALNRLQPGDVLVAPFTGPAYNSLLPIVGAMVVEEGGPMSHAAIVAREFGIPAIVGATGATRLLSDGITVEIDPVAGRITPVEPDPSSSA